MLDPEAFVLGVDGDAGTYAIPYYDWYTEELTTLMNDLLVNDFEAFAPKASLVAQDGDMPVISCDIPNRSQSQQPLMVRPMT